jgi:hypothetical protein
MRGWNGAARCQFCGLAREDPLMNILYIIGVVVVVLVILSFFGLR